MYCREVLSWLPIKPDLDLLKILLCCLSPFNNSARLVHGGVQQTIEEQGVGGRGTVDGFPASC